MSSLPSLSSSKTYFLAALLRTGMIYIHSTVFIFRKNVPRLNILVVIIEDSLVFHTGVSSVQSFIISASVLFSSINEHFQTILFFSYHPFQVSIHIYNNQQHVILRSHLSWFWVKRHDFFRILFSSNLVNFLYNW